jgi:hypothetical protein
MKSLGIFLHCIANIIIYQFLRTCVVGKKKEKKAFQEAFILLVAHNQLLIAKGKTFSPERQSVHTLI